MYNIITTNKEGGNSAIMNDITNIKDVLFAIRDAIIKDGADPEKQLSAYILSEDPIYITPKDQARQKAKELDRDMILKELINSYFQNSQ